MVKRKKNPGLVNEIMHRLEEKDKVKPLRTKRTLVLKKDAYEKFESLCRKEGRYPSDVVDEFIALFIEQAK